MLIEADLKIKYKISSRVDSIDDELISYLKKSGCYRIYFGVESGSQKILDYLQKGIKIEQIKNAFSLSKKYRIDACAYIMIGVPTESKEDIEKTIKLVNEIKPDHLHCSICTPMPKTFLYQKLMQEGYIREDYWQKFAQNPDISFKTPFSCSIYSDKELRDLQNSIQKNFYFNIKIIINELLKTRNFKKLFSKAKIAYKMIKA